MRMARALRPALVTLLLAASVGCAKKRISPPPAPEVPASQGKVAYEFVADATMGKPQLAEHQEFVTPRPQKAFVAAEYPARPLAAKAPPYSIGVRIVINTEGRVSSISDSKIALSTPGPFAADFRASVERAVMRWRFTPGHIDQLEDGDDVDDDGKPDSVRLVGSEPVPVFYDVRFDFEIVDGHGRVTSTAPRVP